MEILRCERGEGHKEMQNTDSVRGQLGLKVLMWTMGKEKTQDLNSNTHIWTVSHRQSWISKKTHKATFYLSL